MITASNKLWATAGAFALAATAVLVPVAAQAEGPGDVTSADAAEVGSAAGRSAARTNRGAANRAAANAGVSTPPESVVSGVTEAAAPGVVSGARATAAPGANALGPNPLFQNPLWWFGTPNPAPPPTVYSRNFDALASLPGWAQGYYGWYEDLNFEACVLGLSSTISPNVGPYGNSTSAISTGGC